MKRVVYIILSMIICIVSGLSFFACGQKPDVISIYMPDGAPALAMAKLMNDNNQFGESVEYSVVRATDISHYIIRESADIAILPVNDASQLLPTGENYKIVATVTHGNLYVVGNKNISSLQDLKGEVVGVIGEGKVPDLTFRHLLASNTTPLEVAQGDVSQPNKVTLFYCSDATVLMQKLMLGQLSFGLLPEPAVSTLLSKSDSFDIQLDIQALWQGGSYPQAVMVAKTSLCEKPEFLNEVLVQMVENETWILSNTTQAVTAINNHIMEGVTASLKNNITSSAISNCNIKIDRMTETEKENIKQYLESIRAIKAEAVGDYNDDMFWGI